MVSQQWNYHLLRVPHVFYLQGFGSKHNAVLFKVVKQEQKHQQEKYLHPLGTSKVYLDLPRWKNHNFIFFFQTYSKFKCHCEVKGVY